MGQHHWCTPKNPIGTHPPSPRLAFFTPSFASELWHWEMPPKDLCRFLGMANDHFSTKGPCFCWEDFFGTRGTPKHSKTTLIVVLVCFFLEHWILLWTNLGKNKQEEFGDTSIFLFFLEGWLARWAQWVVPVGTKTYSWTEWTWCSEEFCWSNNSKIPLPS